MDTLVFWATLSLIVRYFKSFSLFLRNCDQVAPICSRIFFFDIQWVTTVYSEMLSTENPFPSSLLSNPASFT